MSVLKTVGAGAGHLSNLRAYIEQEGKCLAVGRRNLNGPEWEREMARTNDIEDVPARTRTVALHHMIAFNPDEISPDQPGAAAFADRWAGEFAEAEYPSQQVAWGVHAERGDDGVARLAVHMVVNRVLLADAPDPSRPGHVQRAGTLLDRDHARRDEQVERTRSMDEEAGFRQLHGGRNVRSHTTARPTPSERAIERRHGASWKEAMRASLGRAMGGARDLASLREALASDGITLDASHSGNNYPLSDAQGHQARATTLGFDRQAMEAEWRGRRLAADWHVRHEPRAQPGRAAEAERVRETTRTRVEANHPTREQVHPRVTEASRPTLERTHPQRSLHASPTGRARALAERIGHALATVTRQVACHVLGSLARAAERMRPAMPGPTEPRRGRGPSLGR